MASFSACAWSSPGPGPPRTLDADPPSSPGSAGSSSDWLGALALEPDDIDAVVLAVNEAVANANQHGYRDTRGKTKTGRGGVRATSWWKTVTKGAGVPVRRIANAVTVIRHDADVDGLGGHR